MAQIINTNIPSLNAQRNLTTSQGSLNEALKRLSSGLRINSAKDDAAGMAIAENMNAAARGMVVAQRNANDAISAGQTAEAGLSNIAGHLQRMRELAVQAASGQYDSVNREALNAEFKQLSEEVSRVVTATNFNGKQLLTSNSEFFTGNNSTGVQFQVGDTIKNYSQIKLKTLDGNSMAASVASSAISLTGDDGTNALNAMSVVDAALTVVNKARADLGAGQARFEATLSQLSAAHENTEAARSRITDADYGAETAKLARAQILQQAGTAMLAQANAIPQNVLSLIG
ncbi:MAG: flagellin FliC [Zoogloeaceae bacterium]|jgi:flagellin|nr:flagellin FliC [Zoogloeaceae bacterium]